MTTETSRQTISRADAARLVSVSKSQALHFRQALSEAGYLPPDPDNPPEVIEMRSRGGHNLPRLLRLTSAERPLDVFARLFLLGVPVRLPAARSAMKSIPVEEWSDPGLVKIEGELVEGLVAISPFEGLLLATEKPELLDRGADTDYVCSITNSTETVARFMVRLPFANVLDVCTGCGALGLLAARQSAHVLATDLNPRAIQFANFNARLNGIDNIEFAVGSIFEPVRGRKFDLITANPPCILGPASRYSFRDSGRDLDDFCRQIITEAPDFLSEGGIFQCTLEWPDVEGADWRKRISETLHDLPCDALLLHLRTKNVQSHTDETIGDTDVLDFKAQADLFSDYMDYFQSRRVTSISEGLLALRRRSCAGRNWVNLENLPNRSQTPFGNAVYRYFDTSDALNRLGNGLFDLKLRMAPSLSVETSRRWNGKSWEEGIYRIRQGTGFEHEAEVDASIANLVRRCDGTKTLRELVSIMASDAKVTFDAVASGCLNIVHSMMRMGFLSLPE